MESWISYSHTTFGLCEYAIIWSLDPHLSPLLKHLCRNIGVTQGDASPRELRNGARLNVFRRRGCCPTRLTRG